MRLFQNPPHRCTPILEHVFNHQILESGAGQPVVLQNEPRS
jgi:hypothetical protein